MQIRHKDLLKQSFHQYVNGPPDLVILCKDGVKVDTSRLLLSFFSKMMLKLFDNTESSERIFVSVPLSYESIFNLLEILSTGYANSDSSISVTEIQKAAEVLGISISSLKLEKTSLLDKKHPEQLSYKQSNRYTDSECKSKVIKQSRKFKDLGVLNFDPIVTNVEDFHFDEEKHSNEIEVKKIQNTREVEKKSNGLENPLCNMCGKMFTKRSTLVRHLTHKVCERKLINENRVEQMILKATQNQESANDS